MNTARSKEKDVADWERPPDGHTKSGLFVQIKAEMNPKARPPFDSDARQDIPWFASSQWTPCDCNKRSCFRHGGQLGQTPAALASYQRRTVLQPLEELNLRSCVATIAIELFWMPPPFLPSFVVWLVFQSWNPMGKPTFLSFKFQIIFLWPFKPCVDLQVLRQLF